MEKPKRIRVVFTAKFETMIDVLEDCDITSLLENNIDVPESKECSYTGIREISSVEDVETGNHVDWQRDDEDDPYYSEIDE